jgi:nucleotide-binding universal stress UspA family protein
VKRILVGVNDRAEAADALRLTAKLATLDDSEVIAAAVYVFDSEPEADPEAEVAFFEKTRARVERALADTQSEHIALRDSPARALHALAENQAPDLIVVGSTHRGPFGHVEPGSVGERLLNGAPCQVVVAPRGYRNSPDSGIERIGIAYDGLAESARALEEAIWLARHHGAALRLITVAQDFDPMHGGPVELGREETRARLERAVERAADEVEVEGSLEQGDPGDELLRASEGLDLLMLGSRAYGPVEHVLLGSVSARVMRGASCPVLVIPRSAAKLHAPEPVSDR